MRVPPPVFAFLNSEILELSPERARVRFSPTEEMENPNGDVQGGILAAMLDNTIGPAILAKVGAERPTSTIALSVQYLTAARAGQPLIGIAEVIKAGRTQLVIDARLERESDGRLIARGTASNLFLQR